MTDGVIGVLTITAALGSGLIAGFFCAFSVCVMWALGRLPAAHGAAAMQTINVVVINPWFMTAFFGTGVLSAVLVFTALSRTDLVGRAYLIAGGLLYLVGTILVTVLFNVPRNNALATVAPDSAEGAARWAAYVPGWTIWNHVRAATALVAALLFTLAIR